MIRCTFMPLSDLRRCKGRTVLTVLSIAIGVMLCAIVSVIGRTGEHLVYRELSRMGVDGLSITVKDGALTPETLPAVRCLSGVKSAMPLTVGSAVIRCGDTTEDTMLCGIDAGADQVISLEPCRGRLISAGEVRGYARVCLIEENFAAARFGGKNPIGKQIRLITGGGEESYTVVGVATAGSALLKNITAYMPTMVFVPYTTFQESCGSQQINQIAVRTEDGTDDGSLAAALSRVVRRLNVGLEPQVENLAAQKERLELLLRIILGILTFISGISLLVSGIGISTVMLNAVRERTREIGIKKAVGASNGRILCEFLGESALLACLGGMIGLLFGGGFACIGSYLVTGYFGMPLGAFLRIFLCTAAVGGLSGLAPALRAARMPPVAALRSE